MHLLPHQLTVLLSSLRKRPANYSESARTLSMKRLAPESSQHNKNPGGKAWRFIKSELLEYMASGKPKSQQEMYDEMVAEMNKGLRPGGRNRISR